MAAAMGYQDAAALVAEVVPSEIRLSSPLQLPSALGEHEALSELARIMSKNTLLKSCIGMGYHETITPAVIRRNILENPGWYTQYTPYQAEIAQGRLEAMLNFQTLIADLTGLPVANSSLLDEATAAAEAMAMAFALRKSPGNRIFLAASGLHPQTLSLLQTRATPLNIEVRTFDARNTAGIDFEGCFGGITQFPETDGQMVDPSAFNAKLRGVGALSIMSVDPLAMVLYKTPAECGADIAVGSAQRFGVPMGFGGPHAAFLATSDEHKRHLPGRIVGVSKDSHGRPALRLSLQTREQHIRREKATSNICTAQVLLAVMASMFAIFHGPQGLQALAQRIHSLAATFAGRLRGHGLKTTPVGAFFDTVRVDAADSETADLWMTRATTAGYNIRRLGAASVCVAFDELKIGQDVDALVLALVPRCDTGVHEPELGGEETVAGAIPRRGLPLLAHPIFSSCRSETELLRYIRKLESRDLSLCHSMIPLGSCTMKLNASAEMLPLTWPTVAHLHPYAPSGQAAGYRELAASLEHDLAEITGLPAVSLQPNAGSQGEYAGLLAIRRYHAARGESTRSVCFIPTSAHGTNPASAVMAGYRVVAVKCDSLGNIDIFDLDSKIAQHSAELAAIMITYPSTHGVFEGGITEICSKIHAAGALVYMDGANLNAQVGLCRPGDFGVDVCHLNLHKTFCIPHGGGGPGVGPIAASAALAPYLPGDPRKIESGAVSAAPLGSASILTISWMYIRMMGPEGLREATEAAIISANHIARRLAPYYPILYTGRGGLVAHECIIDLRPFKAQAGVEVDDVAKRLMDYGFHAPTMSWPVAGTMMIEPTESESLAELDRFCEAMIAIHGEIQEIAEGKADRSVNLLKGAPHTAPCVTADVWDRPYSRAQAAFPAPWLRDAKFWPHVGRIDNVHGDRNLVCTCPSVEEMAG